MVQAVCIVSHHLRGIQHQKLPLHVACEYFSYISCHGPHTDRMQLRILNGFRFVLRTQRSAVPLSPSQIFQPLITSSTAPLLEIDFNLHKSNSTYFADIDVSRAHLACTLFSRGIEHMRGGTAAYTGSGRKQFGLALGAVSCSFRKEVAPYQNYEMWSKILAWDEKWVYIVTHFVRAGSAAPKSCTLYPQQSGGQRPAGHKIDSATFDSLTSDDKASTDKCLFATALSKCVFKYGRETVAPQKMFKLSGLITPDMSEPVLEQIEAQRVQGLKAASALATENQKALEAEFGGMSTDALGRHSDGSGVMGVVGTLLQLAKLKKSQVL